MSSMTPSEWAAGSSAVGEGLLSLVRKGKTSMF